MRYSAIVTSSLLVLARSITGLPVDQSASNAAALWQPTIGTPWQIVLQGADTNSLPASLGVKIIDVDVIDTSASRIKVYKDQGAKVICYFSAGSYEEWREDWKNSGLKDSDKGLGIDKGDGTYWPGENWINTNAPEVRAVMEKRIQLAKDKGCDAVDPDNVDGYQNNNGLGLRQSDATSYIRFMASAASSRGLSIALKNAAEIIPSVIDVVHFSIQEECHAQHNCGDFAAFTRARKPIFNIEYPDSLEDVDTSEWCGGQGMSTVVKTYDLDTQVVYCDGRKFGVGGYEVEGEGDDEGDDEGDHEDEDGDGDREEDENEE